MSIIEPPLKTPLGDGARSRAGGGGCPADKRLPPLKSPFGDGADWALTPIDAASWITAASPARRLIGAGERARRAPALARFHKAYRVRVGLGESKLTVMSNPHLKADLNVTNPRAGDL